MDINFHALRATGAGDAGGRERFELMITDLVRMAYPTARRIEAAPGDWGIDALVGELDGVISIWQAKYFIDGVGDAQKKQIRESFQHAVAAAAKNGHTIDSWTLCIPCSLDPATDLWWTKWRKAKKQRDTGVRIELWNDTDLRNMLLSPEGKHLRDAYFPSAAAATQAPAATRQLPADQAAAYEGMLFIKQLRAANHSELDSAKRQFFNADLLEREVADKGVEQEVASLQSARADVHAIWETRFGERCTPSPADPLLPGLHGDVMRAIEQLHNSKPTELVPLSLVHRCGSMHQLVDGREAGWVHEWRRIAEEHTDGQ